MQSRGVRESKESGSFSVRVTGNGEEVEESEEYDFLFFIFADFERVIKKKPKCLNHIDH